MTIFEVYYRRQETFREDKQLTAADIKTQKTHVLVAIQEGTKDSVYAQMQGELMDKRTAILVRNMIRMGETHHQSMSVGDVLRDGDTGEISQCAMVGWIPVKGSQIVGKFGYLPDIFLKLVPKRSKYADKEAYTTPRKRPIKAKKKKE